MRYCAGSREHCREEWTQRGKSTQVNKASMWMKIPGKQSSYGHQKIKRRMDARAARVRLSTPCTLCTRIGLLFRSGMKACTISTRNAQEQKDVESADASVHAHIERKLEISSCMAEKQRADVPNNLESNLHGHAIGGSTREQQRASSSLP